MSKYVIYKKEKQITVEEALVLEEDWTFLYIPIGNQVKSNPYFVLAALDYLMTHNLIDDFVYTGEELPVLENVEGRIY